MKVALIGIGRWGSVLKRELEEQVEVKYACDSSSDLEQVFNDPEIEAVFVATPTVTHYDISKRVLEAGKHLFLEKPGTDSSKKLAELVSIAEEKKLKFAVGYEFPHHPAIRKLKELGTPDFIRLEYQKWGTFKESIVTNLLCHDVSILTYLGIPMEAPSVNKVSVVTEADILVTRFGARAMSIINRVNPVKSRTTLAKIGPTSYVWDGTELFEIRGEELRKIGFPETTPIAAELTNFLTSDKPLCDGRFALEVYRVIESVRA